MDEIFRSTVEVNIHLHGSLLGLISITGPASIHKSESKSLSVSNTEFDNGENGVDNHSLCKSIANSCVPFRNHIIERSLENELSWETNFFKVGLGKNQKDGSVEELGHENTIGNSLQLLRVSIFTNPLNKLNHNESENSVDDYNDE